MHKGSSPGSLVREARAHSGLTQHRLGQEAGTSQPAIARIECGRQDPSFGTLERLVQAAGFDLQVELVPRADRTGWPPPSPAPAHDAQTDGLIDAIFKKPDPG
jgi:transcriptional regulator with XRE-family HTH domain